MKNRDNWVPNKYVYKKDKLIGSRNPSEVSFSSRLAADLIAEFFDKNLKLYIKGRLLDLGCGQVPFYEAYRDYITENICVDWENSKHPNSYVDKYVNLNEKLPFDNCEFDSIILSDVLEHIKEPKLLMMEINRVLNKNGILFISVPFFYGLHEEPHDYYRYTKHALNALAIDSGFNILKIETIGGVPEIFADINAKILSKIPIIGRILALTTQKITWLFIHLKCGKKISKITGKKFPMFYALIASKQ